MAHNVSRLYKFRETYYYRVRIPKDLLLYFGGKQDVKRSLHTKSLTQARRLLKVWDCRTEQLFTTMRLGMLSRDELWKLAQNYLHRFLNDYEEFRAYFVPSTKEELEAELQRLERCHAEARAALTVGRNYRGEEHIDFINKNCPDLLEEGYENERVLFERELLKQDVEIYRVELERAKGNYNNGYDDRVKVEPSPLQLPSAATPKEEQSSLLSTVIDKFLADLKLKGSATTNTISDYGNICNQFKVIIGDKEISSITRDNIRHYLDTLKKLPKHIRQKPQYRGKSIKDILAMGETDTLGEKTIHRYATCIQGLLQWSVREGMLDKNPAAGLTPRKSKTRKASEERKAFDKEDLKRLVAGMVKVAGTGEFKGHPERLWVPLIGLYSGMRENEICQLHINDVQQEQETGIWYFNVEATEGDDKSVKTAAGRRPVPIHPDLIDLGFLKYYEKVKADGSPRVWMNLTKTSRGYHRKFACWFLGVNTKGRVIYESFLREHVTRDPLKNFHSFRHTFTNALKQKLVDVAVINELVGHAQGSLALDRYGKGYALKTLRDALLQLDYGLDLKSLRAVVEAIKTGEQKPVS